MSSKAFHGFPCTGSISTAVRTIGLGFLVLAVFLLPGFAAYEALFVDATETHLPIDVLFGYSMDAHPIDVEGDGDFDLLVAIEHGANLLLINDGTGRFTDESMARIPQSVRDSEDIGVADLDGDGDPDVVVVSEDDRVNEMYFNLGDGTFSDEGSRWPVDGTSNAVVVGDVDRDGDSDLLVGNNGQNVLLLNSGSGRFSDRTATHLPAIEDVTQDLELGDVDGDGDLDVLVGNEDRNRLLINDGRGRFTDESESRLPVRGQEETREADFGDVDGDGDLDIVFANTQFFVQQAVRQNRLLINDGTGYFVDETDMRLPRDGDLTVDVDFVDLDEDGDLDLVLGNSMREGTSGNTIGERFAAYLNDGAGVFTLVRWVLPRSIVGNGFDIEAADFNGDGRIDLYFCSRIGLDRLAFGVVGDS
jgi:hypothetical protein